jgi:hydrogenase maturation protease
VKKTRVICLGNETMRDDGAAIHVARALRERVPEQEREFDIVESAVAGYDLLELMVDWERIIFVEAVKLADREAGDIVRLDPMKDAKQLRLCALREASIPEVMAVGPKLGHAMPDELVLLGLQGEDLCTFGEQLSPAVAAAVPRITDEVLAELGARP